MIMRLTFTTLARPYIENKLSQSDQARANNDVQAEFKYLEDAHVIGQQSTFYHTLIHWRMLQYGLRNRRPKEVLGQIIRLVGALTKTAIGLLPMGNTGGANVSAFKPMPLSEENKSILEQIRRAQS
ncbi:DUF3703 domain-containing protein [Aliiglaciecola sp. M165]|uniref:DUF3703 domain-containing protein n=1 Tax=Aliiglaciecola sp. M165 TaxID=2593649 RepID=UPI0021B156D9|nr:DUF3703 domain-containing protein [Aliiglaciecola sp. M165]